MQARALNIFGKIGKSQLMRSFAGAPKLENRYFLLNMDIDLLSNEELDRNFSKHVNEYVDKKIALICFDVPNGTETFLLFHCADETSVYDFVKKVFSL